MPVGLFVDRAVYTIESQEGVEVVERQAVKNSRKGDDFVHWSSGFVWREEKLPVELRISEKDLAKIGVSLDPIKVWQVVRVWAFVINKNEQTAMLWSRAEIIPIDDWESLPRYRDGVYSKMTEEVGKLEYLELRPLLCWTAFPYSPGRPPGHSNPRRA